MKVDQHQIEPFLPAIYEKFEGLNREELIKHFVSTEFNRFLSYYKNAKDINLSEKQNKKNKPTRERLSQKERRKSKFIKFFINVGKNHNVNPSRLIGIINEGLNSSDAVIGKIEVAQKASFLEIESNKTQLIKALNGSIMGGVKLSVEVANEKASRDKNITNLNKSKRSERKNSMRNSKRGKYSSNRRNKASSRKGPKK